MKLAQIVVMQETGEVVYEGGLREFIRDNEEYPGHLIACFRDARNGTGRPEPVMYGGGAAPMFQISLVA